MPPTNASTASIPSGAKRFAAATNVVAPSVHDVIGAHVVQYDFLEHALSLPPERAILRKLGVGEGFLHHVDVGVISVVLAGVLLAAKVPINVAQATLGSKVAVRAIDGKRITIRIPPRGTPSGKRFRVRGQGVKKGSTTGDLIIEVQISVPENLTEDQKKMMEEFAEAGGMKY